MTDRIDIDRITVDPSLQMRETLNLTTIEDYTADLGRGEPFPPVILFQDGELLRLADGFHRLEAYDRAGLDRIPATIFQGDYKAALTYAISANARNGVRRKEGDLARAYRAAVQHGLCEATDTSAVQTLLHCTERWARTMTKAARDRKDDETRATIEKLAEDGATRREIADQIGVSAMTVQRTLVSKRNSSEMIQTQEPTAPPPITDEERAAIDDAPAIDDDQPDHVISQSRRRLYEALEELAEAERLKEEALQQRDPDFPFLDKTHPFAVSMRQHTPITEAIDLAYRKMPPPTQDEIHPIERRIHARALSQLAALTAFYENIEVLND